MYYLTAIDDEPNDHNSDEDDSNGDSSEDDDSERVGVGVGSSPKKGYIRQ